MMLHAVEVPLFVFKIMVRGVAMFTLEVEVSLLETMIRVHNSTTFEIRTHRWIG